jgi:hypothetical protein
MFAFGAICGALIPYRSFGRRRGFAEGVLFGGVFVLLGTVMVADVVAGRMGGLLGTGVGVPVGMFFGSAVGACVSVSIAGAIGMTIARLLDSE